MCSGNIVVLPADYGEEITTEKFDDSDTEESDDADTENLLLFLL